jgi:hypothetical protein
MTYAVVAYFCNALRPRSDWAPGRDAGRLEIETHVVVWNYRALTNTGALYLTPFVLAVEEEGGGRCALLAAGTYVRVESPIVSATRSMVCREV